MKHSIIFSFVIFFMLTVQSLGSIDPELITVKTNNGILRGSDHGLILAFEGIRYAEPPIAERRFEIPTPFEEKWDDVRNATQPGNICLQADSFRRTGVSGSEDCLFLNVYVPKSAVTNNHKLPVLVFIHGGGFMTGHSTDTGVGRLLQSGNFIAVSMNYRLGILGFLSTEDAVLPGNNGLKDQLLAIQWVKNNIAAFNGDPSKVTLTGVSAGGASVHLQMMKRNSEGLFSHAISHCGCVLNPWAIVRQASKTAQQLGEHLNCPTDSSSNLKACLMSLPAEEIVEKVHLFQKFYLSPFTVFGPVVESTDSENPFITEHPLELIRSGNFIQIPWLLGFSKDEGVLNAAILMQKDENGVELIENAEEYWNELAPLILFYKNAVNEGEIDNVTNKIRKHYLKNHKLSVETYFTLQNMVTDRVFNSGFEIALKEQAAVSKAPVYAYIFKNAETIGIGNLLARRYDISFGPGHGADVGYIYDTPMVPKEQEDLSSAESFFKLYKTFITTEEPKFGNFKLKPVDKSGKEFTILEIESFFDARISSKRNFAETEFWENLLPIIETNSGESYKKNEL